MRKSTMFVSAMLTVFLMAILFGVVSAYQNIVKTNTMSSTQSQQKALSQPISVVLAVPTATEIMPLTVTAEEATTIAVDFLGDPNVYSVEVVDYQGMPTYLVTFSSGDLVYVSSEGLIVANSKLQPVVITASNPKSNGGEQAGSGNGGGSSYSGEHENDDDDDDDHEEEHENEEDDD